METCEAWRSSNAPAARVFRLHAIASKRSSGGSLEQRWTSAPWKRYSNPSSVSTNCTTWSISRSSFSPLRPEPDAPRVTKRLLAATAWTLVAGAAAIYVVPLATGHDTPLTRAAAVVVLTMGLLATGALPEYLTSLLFFLLAMLLAIAPAEVVFSGF